MWYDRTTAADFEPNEQVLYPLGEFPPKFVGTVIAVHPKINKVDVQWPSGCRQMSPEDLIHLSALNVAKTVASKSQK